MVKNQTNKQILKDKQLNETLVYYSQIGQEKWVIEILDGKKNGLFVEVGASNGMYLSNTYFLEKNMSWSGLCIEPSLEFKNLISNRNCMTSNDVIFHSSDMQVDFIEDEKLDSVRSFSGINSTIDKHRPKGKLHKRTTKNLSEVLKNHGLPNKIDYLSIDTEGSEYEILKGLDFNSYVFSLITIEHNWKEPKRSKIRELLFDNGYHLDVLADSKFDDWYIHESLLTNCNTRNNSESKKYLTSIVNTTNAIQQAKNNETLIQTLKDQLQEKENFIQQQNKLVQKIMISKTRNLYYKISNFIKNRL